MTYRRSPQETGFYVRLGLPRIIRPEFDSSSFSVTPGMGNTRCLVAQDLALLTKVRILLHEEILLVTVLYNPFCVRTPIRRIWVRPKRTRKESSSGLDGEKDFSP